MDKLKIRVRAELENLDGVFEELPDYKKLPYLSTLELAGVAALLHNFYSGVENVLKQILKSKNIIIPTGDSWHKELLIISKENEIITDELRLLLGDYLAFRHYFAHGYAFDLYAEKMEPLVEKTNTTYKAFKKNIKDFC